MTRTSALRGISAVNGVLQVIGRVKYENVKDALEAGSESDAAFSLLRSDSDIAAGFLGLLPADVDYRRLERKFDLNVVTTLPSIL